MCAPSAPVHAPEQRAMQECMDASTAGSVHSVRTAEVLAWGAVVPEVASGWSVNLRTLADSKGFQLLCDLSASFRRLLPAALPALLFLIHTPGFCSPSSCSNHFSMRGAPRALCSLAPFLSAHALRQCHSQS